MLNRIVSRTLRRVRSGGTDAGITLTELVVTMSLLSIVGALALTTLIGTSKSSNQTTEAGLATAGARTAMGSWTSMLQVAVGPDPVNAAARDLAITPTSISFNAQLENLPSCTGNCTTGTTTKVTLELRTVANEPSQLVQTLTRGSDTQRVVQVPSGAAIPSGGCLFHAYQADGTDYTCTTLTADDTVAVSRIDIAFTVTPSAGRIQSFTSSAKLPGGAT